MSSGLCLEVNLRVPVCIIDDHCVRCLKIDTQTACAQTEQEHEVWRMRGVEEVHQPSTILSLGSAIYSEIAEASWVQETLQQVEHPSHGAKQQHPMATGTKLGQYVGEEVEFGRGAHEVAVKVLATPVLAQQVRVVADLPELNQHVLEGRLANTPFLSNLRIHSSLICRGLTLQQHFGLAGKLCLHLILHTTKQERPKHLMQAIDDQILLLLINLTIAIVQSEWGIEPL
mmetsp:Transcript_18335/g.30123  ORF Transcript_18335/g.30123 Transcript_18335/m.30123 type:complete len:229 (-) Transcript_18335:2786-3472(-)